METVEQEQARPSTNHSSLHTDLVRLYQSVSEYGIRVLRTRYSYECSSYE